MNSIKFWFSHFLCSDDLNTSDFNKLLQNNLPFLLCSHITSLINVFIFNWRITALQYSVGLCVGLIAGSGRSIGEGHCYPLRILAWRIPWTEESGRLQSVGSQIVGHDWATDTFTFCHISTWTSHRHTYVPCFLKLLPISRPIPSL